MALPKLTSGSGGGSIDTTTSDDDSGGSYSTTSFSGGTIDLGHSSASGGSTKYDFENNDAATVDTSDEIEDAGGPQTVLVGNEDQASAVTDAVGDVTGQIRDHEEQQQEPTVVDNTDQNQPANPVEPAVMPPGYDPQTGGLLAMVVGFIQSLLAAVGGLFGGS